ncbi:ATP-binding protein [Burkholderia cepacia]|uniref:ATP-binding protein n=1 Tax=Burkholderia cepacia TaxID=292 RepID=UPI002AB72A7F|nr:ATP-binding protein [Burkholderia cepacia]
MQVLILTGPTGSGKSRALARIKAVYGDGIAIFDPLESEPKTWSEPDRENCRAVAFDHVWSLERPAETIAAAVRWCETHGRALLLIDQRRLDFDEHGISIPEGAIEMRLNPFDAAHEISIVQGKSCISLSSRQIDVLFGILGLLPEKQEESKNAA